MGLRKEEVFLSQIRSQHRPCEAARTARMRDAPGVQRETCTRRKHHEDDTGTATRSSQMLDAIALVAFLVCTSVSKL